MTRILILLASLGMASSKVNPENYIWGYISGLLSIVSGLLWALIFFIASDLQVMYGSTTPSLIPSVAISAVIIIGGFLVFLKHSLGWYLMYLQLFLVGGLFVYLSAGSAYDYFNNGWTPIEVDGMQVGSNPLPAIAILAAIGIGCYLLLWVQIRYWNRRRADVWPASLFCWLVC